VNDTRIEQLNNGTTFPAERILLAHSNDSIASISQTFGKALSAFYPDFAALWNIDAPKPWANYPGIQDHLTNTGTTGPAQALHVKVLF
jgi:hypothetical protein